MSRRAALDSLLRLALLACLGLGATITLQRCTAPGISIAQQTAREQALLDVLPAESYDNHPLQQSQDLTAPGLASQVELLGYLPPRRAFIATRQGQPSAVILQVRAADGYAGPIQLLVGISAQGRLLGVKVLTQQETAGLGARIEPTQSDWLLGFVGKSRQSPSDAQWKVSKDNGAFDQLAGATLTSRAVIKAVHQALQYFDGHRAQLFASAGVVHE